MNLSDFELDVMTVIWQLGECSAPQVHAAVIKDKTVTYSTVKTIIDRLQQKGAIERIKTEGRTIYFKAAIQPDALQTGLVNKLLTTVFAGDRRPLFSQLLGDETLSREDLIYLADLVARRQGEFDHD